MEIKEIYEYFEKIGFLTFATWNGSEVETRIAHFFSYDDDGLYFRTMSVKPFYEQLIRFNKLSVCGMYPRTQLINDENNLPQFEPGYTIRISGDVRELSMEEVEEKAKGDPYYKVAIHDIKKYPATRILVLYKARGEVYDFDYKMQNRDHKLLRIAFAYGGAEAELAGLRINDNCIECGACMDVCTFKAIVAGTPYRICGERCDECGNCYGVCTANAIEFRREQR